jgi:hypothetical protein
MRLALKQILLVVGLFFGVLGVAIAYASRTQLIAEAQIKQNPIPVLDQGNLLGSIPSGIRVSRPDEDATSRQAVDVPFAAAFTRGQNTPVQLSRTADALVTDPQNNNFRTATPTSGNPISPQVAIAHADVELEGRLAVAPLKTTVDYVTFYDPMIQKRREAWRIIYWGSPILQAHYQLPNPSRVGGLTSLGSQSVSQLAVTLVLIDPLTQEVLQVSSST